MTADGMAENQNDRVGWQDREATNRKAYVLGTRGLLLIF